MKPKICHWIYLKLILQLFIILSAFVSKLLKESMHFNVRYITDTHIFHDWAWEIKSSKDENVFFLLMILRIIKDSSTHSFSAGIQIKYFSVYWRSGFQLYFQFIFFISWNIPNLVKNVRHLILLYKIICI